MSLKLLTRTDKRLENKELGVSLKLGFVMPDHVAEIMGIFRNSQAAGVKVALYALREFIAECEVDGEGVDPKRVSHHLDVMDPDNQAFLLAVSSLVVEHLLVSDETKKKSGSEQ